VLLPKFGIVICGAEGAMLGVEKDRGNPIEEDPPMNKGDVGCHIAPVPRFGGKLWAVLVLKCIMKFPGVPAPRNRDAVEGDGERPATGENPWAGVDRIATEKRFGSVAARGVGDKRLIVTPGFHPSTRLIAPASLLNWAFESVLSFVLGSRPVDLETFVV
jgi:hypothetical protein